jgi:cathepsin A (carboxypeptidase C)
MNFLLAGDWMRPYVEYIPPLLESGIKVLIYAGDADYICNWIGNKAWTVALEWSGSEQFAEAEDVVWKSKLTGKEAGELRMFENFAFLRVYEAGHMVRLFHNRHLLQLYIVIIFFRFRMTNLNTLWK